jgi:O-acetyl-ADP-ribose deacetylase (regulator of RNase III)
LIAVSPKVLEADITTLHLDAIVNAAGSSLIPGGGVDGAINNAAGPLLAEAMRAIGRCKTGQAVITPGFDLPVRFVIHTVAPIHGNQADPMTWSLLESCYRNALNLAARNDIVSIAFPSLGTGAYGLPIGRASEIAISTVLDHLNSGLPPIDISFCCFSRGDAAIYNSTLERLNG